MRLYSRTKERLYLNASERRQFAHVARTKRASKQMLCLFLLYTGSRVSEALHIVPRDLQCAECVVSINSLKKRTQTHLREVPIPHWFARELQQWTAVLPPSQRLWSIDRATAWRWVKEVMHEANIHGAHASPKGLRHSFGVHAVSNTVPLSLVQKWMGHADMNTTAIYTQVLGPEEQQLAAKMW